MSSTNGWNNAENQRAEELSGEPPRLIFEAIRREGARELERKFSALWWSGVAAGLAISTSVLTEAFLLAAMPETAWSSMIAKMGYATGFLIVILGRMQLFTENTITPILSLFVDFSKRSLGRTARLWGIVFVANMVGCLAAAAMLVFTPMIPPDQMAAVRDVSTDFAEGEVLAHLWYGMPAGFLIASLVWILPRLDGGGEFLAIFLVAYIIGLGDLSHVIAGSTKLFVVMFDGGITPLTAAAHIGASLLGNVIGGTGMFAALTYAQVREEL